MPATEAKVAARRPEPKPTSPTPVPAAPRKVLPEREAAEVERRVAAFHAELAPPGEVGLFLVRLAAIMSARVERCVDHETAVLTERVRKAEADFVPPEGCPEAEAGRLRREAGKRALFDPSPEAAQARKYEAAAARGFFQALKELRALERRAKAAKKAWVDEKLASIFPGEMLTEEQFNAMHPEATMPGPREAITRPEPLDFDSLGGRFDVPFAIGKRR